MYDNFSESYERYINERRACPDNIAIGRVALPFYADGNSYLGNAEGVSKEINKAKTPVNLKSEIVEENGEFYIEIEIPKEAFVKSAKLYGTDNLTISLYSEAKYENPDGSPLMVDTDYSDNKRCENPTAGPFEGLKPGKNKILIWRNKK